MRRLLGLFAVVVLSGCTHQVGQEREGEGMTCNVATVSRDLLVIPTTQKLPSSKHATIHESLAPQVLVQMPLSFLENVQRCEAQMSDVPVPVVAKPVGVSCGTSGGTMLAYECSLSKKDLVQFYTQEMERLGWQQVVEFSGDEVLLTFKKPGRFCTACVRPTRKSWERSKKLALHLFVGCA